MQRKSRLKNYNKSLYVSGGLWLESSFTVKFILLQGTKAVQGPFPRPAGGGATRLPTPQGRHQGTHLTHQVII